VNTGLAIGGALASACCFAISSVLQHRGASQAPDGGGLHLDLLAHLMARPTWLFGLLAAIGTLVLQILALASGPLILVQPLLATGLLFALPVSVLLESRRPSLVEWSWAALLVGGLAVFLVAASPGAGPPLPDDRRLVMIVAGGFAFAAIAAGIGYGPGRRHRAALLGFATGIGYGLAAALMKYTVALSRHDPSALLTTWPVYALLAVGAAAIVSNQAAYQAGPLAGGLPAIVILDSIVAIIASAAAFHENISTAAPAITFQIVGFVTMAFAIVALARQASGRDSRSPTGTPTS
jgi:drug/metabolite transporter (DMT)-like permease